MQTRLLNRDPRVRKANFLISKISDLYITEEQLVFMSGLKLQELITGNFQQDSPVLIEELSVVSSAAKASFLNGSTRLGTSAGAKCSFLITVWFFE